MPKATPSVLPDKYESFDSVQDAAVKALRGITERHVETGGGILYNPDTTKYAYTSPVGQNDGAHFQAIVHIPAGWQLAGIYHIHPVGQQSTLFSQDDVNASRLLKVPSYILPLQDNKIRGFTPGVTPVSKSVTGEFSKGDTVDESPPLAAAN